MIDFISTDDRITSDDTMEDLITGFSGGDMVITVAGDRDGADEGDLDDDVDRLAGGIGDDVLFYRS